MKLVYLATKNIEKKWNQPLHNWSTTVQQLSIKFEGRLKLDIWSISNSKDRSIVRTRQGYINGFVPSPPLTEPANRPKQPLKIDRKEKINKFENLPKTRQSL